MAWWDSQRAFMLAANTTPAVRTYESLVGRSGVKPLAVPNGLCLSASKRICLRVDWLEWKAEVVLRNGKISALTMTLTPESGEKLEKSMGGRAEES